MKRITLILLPVAFTAIFIIGSLFWRSSSATEVTFKNSAPAVTKKIRILPLGTGCSDAFIRETQRHIQKFIPNAELIPATKLPALAYYKPRGRYRADSLIQWMGRMAKSDEVILGITTVDISASRNEIPDWGVMGLGYSPGNAAVASPFRMKDKSQFWKVAIHELGHTHGLPHCPNKNCFMRSAEGGNPTAQETGFCPTCSDVLRKAGWRVVESRE